MAEVQTFREGRIEACKKKLTSRFEAIAILQTVLRKMNRVNAVRFDSPRDMKKNIMQGLGMQVLSDERQDVPVVHWTQNPRHVISHFLQDIVGVFSCTHPHNLEERIKQCLEFHKRENPEQKEIIRRIYLVFMIGRLAREAYLFDTIEQRNSIQVLLMSMRINTKALLWRSLKMEDADMT